MICLYTKNLVIRDHKSEDIETHHRLLSDNKAMYYLPDIKTHSFEESKNNLYQAIEQIYNPQRRFYFLRIETKQNQHVGEIGYTVTSFTPLGKLVGLGYFTLSEYWGKGMVTEAAKEMIRFAFEDNDVFRISSGCLKENIGSEKVMIKCGMVKEAEYKQFTWHDNRMKDRVEYRLLRDEWRDKDKNE